MKTENQTFPGIYHPKWIIFTLSIPQTLLFWIFYQFYYLISPTAEKAALQLFQLFGGLYLALLLGFSIYAGLAWVKKRKIHLSVPLLIIVSYITFTYSFLYTSGHIITWPDLYNSINPGELLLYYFTCLCPVFFYSLLFLMYFFTPDNKKQKAWLNFLITIAVPIISYIYINTLVVMHVSINDEWFIHLNMILCISATIIFLLFLIRTIYILFQKKNMLFIKLEKVWIFLAAVLFPVLGLYINHHLNGPFLSRNDGIFGDFSHPLYYIIAVFNGGLLLLPSFQKKIYQQLVFFLKIMTLPYTLYFFLIFLPFFPLSVIAVIAFGLGFLMLSPLALGLIHFLSLKRDYLVVKSYFQKRILWLLIFIVFMIIPSGMTINYLRDRVILQRALNFIYQPDYVRDRNIDIPKNRLAGVIKRIIRSYRNNTLNTPYLSLYYNWLVFDNLTLADNKITAMEKIFIDKNIIPYSQENEPSGRRWFSNISSDNTIYQAENIKTDSKYSQQNQCYTTWLHLTIKNSDTFNKEYIADIKLPEGAFINDYYLVISNKKVPGLLTEKKAALWIYNQIVNRQKDPGILYYICKNEVQLKVFPVPGKDKRFTGIKIIHPEPAVIQINGQTVQIGERNAKTIINKEIISGNKNVLYLPASVKQELPLIKRRPYFHFILDYSEGNEMYSTNYTRQMQQILKKNLIPVNKAKITFANYAMKTVEVNQQTVDTILANPDKLREQLLKSFSCKGGFFLSHILAALLFEEAVNNTLEFPVYVILSPEPEKMIFINDLEYFQPWYPELNDYYLTSDSVLIPCNLFTDRFSYDPVHKSDNISYSSVLCWPDKKAPEKFIRNNGCGSLITLNNTEPILKNTVESNYLAGLTLYNLSQYLVLHPEKTEKFWPQVIQASYTTRILCPATSFIVLENETQRRVLYKAQKEIMSGKKYFSYKEETNRRMSEPDLIILLVLISVYLLFKRGKRKYNLAVKVHSI